MALVVGFVVVVDDTIFVEYSIPFPIARYGGFGREWPLWSTLGNSKKKRSIMSNIATTTPKPLSNDSIFFLSIIVMFRGEPPENAWLN